MCWFPVVAIKITTKLVTCSNMNLLSSSSGGQKSEMRLRCRQAVLLWRGPREEFVFLVLSHSDSDSPASLSHL